MPATIYAPLSDEQIATLRQQGCTAEDWTRVRVAGELALERVRNVQFCGTVELGDLSGDIECENGFRKPAGIYNAILGDCNVASGVRIANVGVHLLNYHIGQGACIEDVGVIEAHPAAMFGNGVRVESLNEGGGREVTLFNELSAQFAYLQCLARSRPQLTDRLDAMANAEAATVQRGHGIIAARAVIRNVKQIKDVDLGEGANVMGAASLVNGTVLSAKGAETTIGTDVQAEDFIVAEGTVVDGGAMLHSVFVGQGSRIGRQFSAEGSVFFANCEGFHGEACSIFAGPYTVTHHKSSLLIAGMFSFYNAGSGTNQSNHMYKLGPVHEGKLERGCKTGSFAYLMWPCRVGPFSVVLGKHTRPFDARDFPFSHLEATSDGRCQMVPGLYLSTVGTVRDGTKWPQRDRRAENTRRDKINFAVFSPFTMGRMIRGLDKLLLAQQETDRAVKTVTIDGLEIRRVLLRAGAKYYRSGLEMYLLDKVLERVEQRSANGAAIGDALTPAVGAVFSEEWIDVGGQLMPLGRFESLCDAIESGQLETIRQLRDMSEQIAEAHDEDEWAWVRWAYGRLFDRDLGNLDVDELCKVADAYLKVRSRFLNLILADAEKEFAEFARVGFGVTASSAEAADDFTAVRGTYEGNSFVGQIKQEIEQLRVRVASFQTRLGACKE